jgi:ethanolamine ammonia-lyase small subunit
MTKFTKRLPARSVAKPDQTKSLTTPAAPTGLRGYTPARVSLQRTGVSLATSEILDFQLAHAQARDAVRAHLDADHLAQRLRSDIHALAGTSILTLASASPDRATYLRRPDLGRILSNHSASLLLPTPCGIVIVIADGLSAVAVEQHAVPLLAQLIPALVEAGWSLGPICIATQARVAIADQIGHTLNAQLTVVLIGERPGLSSPDSLGAYITWAPQPGRTDAERNCVSNIRAAGLDYSTAAARIAFYCNEARRLQLTGTALKETSELGLSGN